ncbi:hypothetical protein CAOG_08938 [Capsaspora owczarzaki ATCC 30864]|uniref:Small-subunit processome Utp12 domain-containing protein n=1 Tax=Capsaspora owczarzaki (strain ATCC 30864) TaxID=595528 RepID=A0A0D2UKQ3_CAPO3|nr:hypothetical protein CAOG_08938 [Capsaspora owczarzaki ATCC 30864]KJE95621.1 hypothetical protein CAOG_008938 [Capsaspora owczarzaki ATCC 30864]|eukprot:XP_011270609.1 hypothetical protein CAOG_08938 [Capsaspora owczarzaki ATCC 30864]
MSASKPTHLQFDGPRGDQFAAISADGRLRVYRQLQGLTSDLLTFTDASRLADPVTCIALGTTTTTTAAAAGSSDETGKKNKKRRVESATAAAAAAPAALLAYGTASGSVVIFSIQEGAILHTLAGAAAGSASSAGSAALTPHADRVNCLAWREDGETLFSGSADKTIIEWNARTGQMVSKWKADKLAVNALAYSAESGTLLSAGRSIKLWDLATKKEVKSFTGHEHNVTALAFLPTTATGTPPLFVSVAAGERMINVWDPSSQSAAGVSVALASLTAKKAVPLNASCSRIQDNFYIAAPCDDGVARVWSFPVDKRPSKPTVISAVSTIQFKNSNVSLANQPVPIFAATFAESTDARVTVCRDTLIKPSFEAVAFLSEQNVAQENVLLSRDVTAGLLLDSNRDARASSGAVQQNVTVVSSAPTADKSAKNAKAKSSGADDEVTLEQQLDTLQLNSGLQQQLQQQQSGGLSGRAPPKAHSLVQMLVQALHSGDNQLLEDCLSVSNEAVIRNTMKKLPASYVIPFLTLIVEKFQAKPSRGLTLLIWIRGLLLVHTAYLMTVPNLVEALSGLYQLVDARLSVFKKLLKLSGRLDLIISQIASRAQVEVGDNDIDEELTRPRTVYQEDSEEEGELAGDGAMDFDDLHDSDEDDDDDLLDEQRSGRRAAEDVEADDDDDDDMDEDDDDDDDDDDEEEEDEEDDGDDASDDDE